MKFSIIIPSYNQPSYISETLENLINLKITARKKNIFIELLLFDNCSDEKTQLIIEKYRSDIDFIEIKKDMGQYDAINKGIQKASGDYWTWLNTDDLIDEEGFFKLEQVLQSNQEIDYIYGGIKYMNDESKYLFTCSAKPLTLNYLINKNSGIFQPGSFFKVSFTEKIGNLKEYTCCFDYEYILRCLKNNANFYCCNFPLASFRYYNESKTGKLMPVFIMEQLQISASYGRKVLSFLTWFSHLRLLKHKLFPRK
ncbi:MAG: glycosyltransferase [Bacteroidia bacterium]